MRRAITLAAMTITLLGVATSWAAADDTAKTAAKAVTNTMCPVMNEASSPKWRTEYQGQYVYFCCSGCTDTFSADPEAAIAKLSAEDKAAIQKNTVCPVSGETIESFDTRSEVDGKLVYFCCSHCKEKFDKEHPAAR